MGKGSYGTAARSQTKSIILIDVYGRAAGAMHVGAVNYLEISYHCYNETTLELGENEKIYVIMI